MRNPVQVLLTTLLVAAVSLCGCLALAVRPAPSHAQHTKDALLLFQTRERAGRGFKRERGLWAMDAEGGHRRLLGQLSGVTDAEWAPTGAAIGIFQSPEGLENGKEVGRSSIRVVPLQNASESRGSEYVLRGRSLRHAHWLPDGRRILFLWHKGPSGIGLPAMTEGFALLDTATGSVRELYSEHGRVESDFAVRPDGQEVAVAGDSDLTLFTMAGKMTPRLRVRTEGPATTLSYSHDGRFVACTVIGPATSSPQGETEQMTGAISLWVYDAKTGKAERIRGPTQGLSWHVPAVWDPASTRCAFTVGEMVGRRISRSHLYFASLERGKWHVTEVLTSTGVLYPGGWSDDGSRFTYVLGDGVSARIYVADRDGRGGHPVSPAGAYDIVPSWQPRG